MSAEVTVEGVPVERGRAGFKTSICRAIRGQVTPRSLDDWRAPNQKKSHTAAVANQGAVPNWPISPQKCEIRDGLAASENKNKNTEIPPFGSNIDWCSICSLDQRCKTRTSLS